MMLWTRRFFLIIFLSAAALTPSVSAAAPLRTLGLQAALADPGAVRTAYFVRGMNCRACTIIIDRTLNGKDGIYWARFNYPIRQLVVFHDPGKITSEGVEAFIDRSGELDAVLMASGKAMDYAQSRGTTVGDWRGGSLSLDDALASPEPFLEGLQAYMIERGTEEWNQVAYEIAAEKARNRIFRDEAERNGYAPGEAGGEMPVVMAKAFYWPANLLHLTAEEAAVARFVKEKVIAGGDSEKEKERFDSWLEDLWRGLAFDYRGEMLELQEKVPVKQ
jgi:hypothetical protein